MSVLIRQLHPLRRALKELALESGGEEGGYGQNILVGSEYSTIRSHHQGDNGAGQGTVVSTLSATLPCGLTLGCFDIPPHRRAVQALLQLRLCVLAKGPLARLDRLARPIP